jgi:hypothetical protein
MTETNDEISNNLTTFLITLFYTICPSLPFSIADIYYSHHPHSCIENNHIGFVDARYWLMVNGYATISSILVAILVFISIYKKSCECLTNILHNNLFIKTYIFLKLLFNICWTIIGTIIFSTSYQECPFNLSFYIWLRISTMFLFILLSMKRVKKLIIDNEEIKEEREESIAQS